MAELTFSPVEVSLPGLSVNLRPFLERKLVKINKRLVKVGAPPATLIFGPEVERKAKDEFGFTQVWREFEVVTVTGSEAKFAGWTGVAVLDHSLLPEGWTGTETGEALISKFPGQEDTELPEQFRFRGPVCDHCRIAIRRNTTIVFRHDDGRWLQVGTSCVRDFIGVDPSNVLWLSTRKLGFGDDDEMSAGSGRRETPPFDFLAAASEVTRLFGFVKSRPDGAYDTPTKYEANTLCGGRLNDYEKKRYADVDYKRGAVEAEKIMAWVAESANGSDFMRSASVACRAWKVTDKTDGILAALPFSYMKAMGQLAERKAKAAERPDEFIGTVGAKLAIEGTVTFKMAFEPYAWNGPTPYRLTVMTDDGHTVTTKGSGNTLWEAQVGDRVSWTGKVVELEDHETYGKRTEMRLVKVKVLVPANTDEYDERTGCEGHETDPEMNGPAGVTFYCDGRCLRSSVA